MFIANLSRLCILNQNFDLENNISKLYNMKKLYDSCESKSCESNSCESYSIYRKILHDIRNMKNLTNEDKYNIQNMSNKKLIELIYIYNDIVNNLMSTIDY